MDRDSLKPLVLREECIRHPFRQSLPIKIAEIAREENDSKAATTAKDRWLGDDISLFLLSFLAFFTAFYMFIF
tara:strand:- start:16144 stop:16362 length:219 start_codon:yes stop_codon:yes gene_type:complete